LKEFKINGVASPLFGTISMKGDKSISHRAIIFASLASGTTQITNLLESDDVIRTIKAFQAMGVYIEKKNDLYVVESKGIKRLTPAVKSIYFGNSGTTARLIIGILSGLPFKSRVYGDPSLTRRPMDRVIKPLKKMGASISGENGNDSLPLTIQGIQLHGIDYKLPIKSAQVKSSLLLAGLLANSETTLTELDKTRDHTELMLKTFGGNIKTVGNTITIQPSTSLIGKKLTIPGDISSASFWIVGALILPESNILLRNVGLNPTRTGIIDVLEKMGASLIKKNLTEISGEICGDLVVKYQSLRATTINGHLVPRLIDEIPLIALLATQASGTTIIKGAEELRVKETDRIEAVVNVLSKLGANIRATDDGMIIKGNSSLTGGEVSSYGDHRIAMMIVIASLIIKDEIKVDDLSSISISYPDFFEDLKQLTKGKILEQLCF